MYAVIYRWKLKPGTEDNFRDAWRRGTIDIRDRFGTGGSRLHHAEDGTWVAYARWASKEDRDRALEGPPSPAVEELRGYVEDRLEEISLEITDDLLSAEATLPFGTRSST